MKRKTKKEKFLRRKIRTRSKIFGTTDRPRLCVFRSAKHIYAQLIDDEKGKTLIYASDFEVDKNLKSKKISKTSEKARQKEVQSKAKILSGKVTKAFEVGKLIAEKALNKKIKKVVFDRGGYKYHGRIKSLAEGAREGGLLF